MTIKDLAKKIALTALATIYGNTENINAETNVINLIDSETDDGRKIFAEKINLILKRPDLDYNRYLDNPDSHRSHRSHSSHRSHYSGHNSGHLSHYSHYSSSVPSPTPAPKTYTTPPVYKSTPPPVYKAPTYSLGDRIIKPGFSGDDIIQLKRKLRTKGYLTEYPFFGSDLYDSATETAVKKFQSSLGLTPDGIIGQTTIFNLSYDIKESSKPSTPIISSTPKPSTPITSAPSKPASSNKVNSDKSYVLGDRYLQYGMSGSDVRKLKELLTNHNLYKGDSSNSYFNYETKMAVKKFQSNKGLAVDGIVGKNTVKELNNKSVVGKTTYPSPPINTDDSKVGKTYVITTKTSLRKGGGSKANVIDRLSIGERVVILNSVENTYWWKVKVVYSGKIGWVKKHLLNKDPYGQ